MSISYFVNRPTIPKVENFAFLILHLQSLLTKLRSASTLYLRAFSNSMRKLFSAFLFTTLCSVFSQPVFAQDKGTENANDAEIKKPSRDFLMLQFTYEGWTNTPDTVKTGGLGRGFHGECRRQKRSPFPIGAGIERRRFLD